LLFLLNFAMNWWLLWGAAILLRKQVRNGVLCAGAAFGAASALAVPFVPLCLAGELVLKVAVAATMVAWCFRPAGLMVLVRHTVVFFALSTFSAGITYAAALSTTAGEALPRVEWFLVAAGPLLASLPLGRLWSSLAACFRAVESARRFRFCLGGAGGTAIELEAVLDTGNTLLEPFTFRPVVVVDTALVVEQLPPRLAEVILVWQEGNMEHLPPLPDDMICRVTLIPYSTVAAGGLMFAVRPEVCEVESKGVWYACEAVVAFAVGDVRLAGRGALLPRALWPLS
jgi:stage II sporulation protein GA (sporulation sigma-E factor processing peptidase)